MTGMAVHLEFLPAACRNLLQIGIGLALQSTLLLAAGLLAARCLRRRGPLVAALVYRASLLATVLGTLLAVSVGGRWPARWTPGLPSAQVAAGEATEAVVAPAAPALAALQPRLAGGPGLGLSRTPAPRAGRPFTVAAPEGAAAEARLIPGPAPASVAGMPPRTAAFRTTRFGWSCVLLVGLWAGGAAMPLVRLAACCRSLARLRVASVPAGAAAVELLHRLCAARGIRPPLLRVSPRVQSPVLIGLRHPAILLPASYARDFDSETLRAVLAHELAHMERRDCAWLLLVRLAGAVGSVQPLLWSLARVLEESSEAVCDQEVLRRDVRPDAYARCLVELAARLVPTRAERALGAGIAPGRSALERRVRMILSGAHRAAAPLPMPDFVPR